MRIVRLENGSWELQGVGMSFGTMRLRTKLLLAMVPCVVVLLAVTGYVTHWFANKFLLQALERNVATQALAIAHELEIFLHQCREDLLVLAQGPMTQVELLKAVQARSLARGYSYKEVAFISSKPRESILILNVQGGGLAVRSQDLANIQPSPLGLLERLHEMNKDTIWISDIVKVSYPPSQDGTITLGETTEILRFSLPYFGDGRSPKGVLVVGVELKRLREVMSLFNSPRSPLFAFVRSPAPRYSFLFDREGWMLFEAEAPENQGLPLSLNMAREGLSGVFGRPGLGSAFKPDKAHTHYWEMVYRVLEGKHGVMGLDSSSVDGLAAQGYAPVRFTFGIGEPPLVLFGVSFVDRSRLPLLAGYRQVDVMFVITLLAILLVAALIYLLSSIITRPILEMAGSVKRLVDSGRLEEIQVDARDYETKVLGSAVNSLVRDLRDQMEQIKARDEQLEIERQRERVRLEEEIRILKQQAALDQVEGLVGVGPLMERLKSEILKAASVDADVLIIGETGTGKQLIAEAIHRHSKRRSGPFISINCGALDENLLLDTLFGHVRGAFTEAKEERKGAFVAAHGGTLFLDEIGTASAKVQQALLRVLSMRKVRPLGSDKEVDVDVRVIAASNVELKELMAKGGFREDLYYRLEVLTIRTPPLREHKENIPLLVDHFLKQATRLMNREGLGISRGALEKLKDYHWPGNVRELMNCITRAVAMAEGQLIQAEDIKLGEELRTPVQPEPIPTLTPLSSKNIPHYRLNPRQRKILAEIQARGRITRAECQEILGVKVSPRTALYDLQDMVAKGILRKVGRGPATQYEMVESGNNA